MKGLRLSFASGAYDRVRPLLEGTVGVEGVDLVPVRVSPASELFWRMLRHEEFDVSELSLSNYIMEVARGLDRFVAIPVFPHRAFRQSALWVRADSPVHQPEDLKSKRIGIPEYSMTMMLVVRGFLSDDHGIAPSDVTWVAVRRERMDYALPQVPFEHAPEGSRLEDLLARGDVDAIVTTRTPTTAAGSTVRRLFANVQEVEQSYYRRTQIFPIMHLIAIRRSIYEANRWLAANLVSAFESSKSAAYEWLRDSQPYASLPWFSLDLEREWAAFDGDPFPYGVAPNLPTLTAAVRWSLEQGLSPRPIEVEELFPIEAVDPFASRQQR
jgi:4,5-dihydroxyphthalate decarboxylase